MSAPLEDIGRRCLPHCLPGPSSCSFQSKLIILQSFLHFIQLQLLSSYCVLTCVLSVEEGKDLTLVSHTVIYLCS